MYKIFYDRAWEDYEWWALYNKKIARKINELLKSIERDGVLRGKGNPEALKHDLSGWYSRRLDKENRLVYRIEEGKIEILQCKGHYDKNEI